MERMDRWIVWLGLWCLGSVAALAQEPEIPAFDTLLALPAAEQVEWAARFEHGEGMARDYLRAVRLYCTAAAQGNVEAQYQLGWLYANGRGVPRDDALAAAWFQQAAEQDDTHAERMLALMDVEGELPDPGCVAPTLEGGLQEIGPPDPDRQLVEDWVHQLAPDYELDPSLVLAVITAESNFNTEAVSPKNAMGLMQLIPATAERFGVEDVLDPLQNLHGGMAYLRWLLAFFEGDVSLALAGYNAGERAVERFGGIPPYPETRAYVTTIMRRYPKASHPVSLKVKPARLMVPVDEGAGSDSLASTEVPEDETVDE